MSRNKIIISGVHMELTEALKTIVNSKIEKLFKHEASIICVRVELICDVKKGTKEQFTAKGHIEINGPNLIVSETTEDLYKSLDRMINKLDRKLRRRARLVRVKRKHTHGIEISADLPKVHAY